MNLSDLLLQAVKASIKAGAEILDVYAQPINVEIKDDKSPLTEADKRSHQAIMAALQPLGIQIMSEEGKAIAFAERKDWEYYWLIDPLDGTKEFIKRNGEFTVNIALINKGRAIAGVIYVPVLNELFFAAEGTGAYKIENYDNASQPATLDALKAHARKLDGNVSATAFTVVASRSHLTPETEALINDLRTKHGTIEMVSKGSSLKLCLVAEGKANIYPRLAPTMEWDTAAGQAICEQAGCTVINYHSQQPMQYNKEDLLNPWFVVSR
ncbi:MAG: 3'(2'),5'-bisphosphate nucleotidase CysQ [Bacteroidetes bacterium]|nr:3'(2'),5'-bisphosphate nucleotidase CysQ [Bacteroidota bacterium]